MKTKYPARHKIVGSRLVGKPRSMLLSALDPKGSTGISHWDRTAKSFKSNGIIWEIPWDESRKPFVCWDQVKKGGRGAKIRRIPTGEFLYCLSSTLFEHQIQVLGMLFEIAGDRGTNDIDFNLVFASPLQR